MLFPLTGEDSYLKIHVTGSMLSINSVDGHMESQATDHLDTTILAIVKELVGELRPHARITSPISLDSVLTRDLGLDSLARVELVSRLERTFNITLPERIFADAETPRDLKRAIQSMSFSRHMPGEMKVEQHVPEKESEIHIPHSVQTLVDVLKWHVQKHPDRVHIRFYSDDGEGGYLTYRMLLEGATAVAGALQKRGLAFGDRVAIMLPTCEDYFFAFMGVLYAGGVPVPMYPPARRSQIEDHLRRNSAIVKNCGASLMIIMPEVRRFAQFLKTQVESLRFLVTVRELTSEIEQHRDVGMSGHDIAFLQYTSGSTGNPKGVILTHAHLLANMRTMGAVAQVRTQDVIVSWLPLYHDMGLIGTWLNSLYYACMLVIMSPLSFLTRPERWLWAIHRYGGTLSAAPNFAYELCCRRVSDENIRGLDLSSWRVACNGAEMVSPETVERFCQRFSRYGFHREAFMPVYGLAECTLCLTFPPLERGPLIDRIHRDIFMKEGRAVPAGDEEERVLRFVSCGRPVPGHEVRIVDSFGVEVPERQEGRLQFRGPSATSGYFRNPEDTKKLFHDGWLESGDLAYVAEGEVFITGRVKDMIVCAGRNIYPQELEEEIGNIEGIRKGNVVVFGSADSETGTEQLIVMAETREEDPQKREVLREMINKVVTDLIDVGPKEVVLLPSGNVLKTSSGKIRRAANRELYETGKIGKPQGMSRLRMANILLTGVVQEFRRVKRITSAWAYAAYCWIVFGMLAPLTWLYVVLVPKDSWRWKFMRRAVHLLARACRIPIFVHGLDNFPQKGPCVIVSNHASYIDSFLLVGILPREMTFVAKVELAQNLLIRTFLNRIGIEYVERFDVQKGVEDAHRILSSARAGRILVFFPEGTFTRMPGLLPFHMGAFLASAEAHVPIVPVAIRGTRSILLDDTWFPRRGIITVNIGKPIHPEDVKEDVHESPWKTALKLRDAAREFILRHCGEPDVSYERSPLVRNVSDTR